MRSYVVRRILEAFPLIFGVIFLTFMIIHIAPGDPVFILAGEGASPEYIDRVREYLGMNKSLLEQFFMYMGAVLRGDLGYSFMFRQPVLQLVLQRIPATLLLMGAAIAISSTVGVILGVFSSKRPYSLQDSLTTSISLFGYSLPVFWLAQILLLIFAITLGWFPTHGMFSAREELTEIENVLDVVHHLTLPALALAMSNLALITRLTRASMLEVLRQDFITSAWAKGLDEKSVLYRHAFRNALLPVVTMLGLNVGMMLTGAVLTETVFGWPGLGRLMYEAINTRDYPVLMGNFIIVSVSVVSVNLVTDLVYALLDPRIRHM
jgi:peptide/nickel transport system permease protein